MPSRKPASPVLDNDHNVDAVEEAETPDAGSHADALALADQAEAEAAEAEAVAAAARARARAIRLRREAQSGDTEAVETEAVDSETVEDEPVEAEATDLADTAPATEDQTDVDEPVTDETATEEPKPRRRLRLPRVSLRKPPWKKIVAAVSIICTCGLIAASGYLVWHHRQAEREQQRSAEFAAAARQGVVTLMSLDYNKVKENVKSIVDSTTGDFKKDFQNSSDDFVKVAQQSKAVTTVAVNSTAVESMTDDTAVVLVAATSKVTNDKGAKQEPRPWRLRVDVARDGDQLKLSKVEFVP